MHYAFDAWLQRDFSQCPFARYSDDAVVHCRSQEQAQEVMHAIASRLVECGLTKDRFIVRITTQEQRGVHRRAAGAGELLLGDVFSRRVGKAHCGDNRSLSRRRSPSSVGVGRFRDFNLVWRSARAANWASVGLVGRCGRWRIRPRLSRMLASEALVELALSATFGHWPAHRLRRSNVSGTQVPDIQIRARSGKSSALCEAEIMSSMLGRGCRGAHSIVGLSAAINEFFPSSRPLQNRGHSAKAAVRAAASSGL
jgi:hypothetical protein